MRLDVPGFSQESGWTCLPACIRMCLAYLGHDLGESTIVRACGSTRLGTSWQQAIDGLERLGFECEFKPGSDVLFVLQHIAVDRPVILGIHRVSSLGIPTWHAVVVCGADETAVQLIDPIDGGRSQLEQTTLRRLWSLAGGGALVIESS